MPKGSKEDCFSGRWRREPLEFMDPRAAAISFEGSDRFGASAQCTAE